MSLLDMTALWFSLMIVGNTTFSRLAKTFEEILETTLLKLIGQYPVIFFWVLIFRDESNVGFIKFWWYNTQVQKIQHTFSDTLTHNRPKMLIKKGVHTV